MAPRYFQEILEMQLIVSYKNTKVDVFVSSDCEHVILKWLTVLSQKNLLSLFP